MANGLNCSPALLDSLYAVLEDDQGWEKFLAVAAPEIGVAKAFLNVRNLVEEHYMLYAHGFARADIQDYFGNWEDPWMKRLDLGAVVLGRFVPSQEICPDDVLEAEPVYQQYLKPRGMHYGGGILLYQTDRQMVFMSMNRPKEHGPLSQESINVVLAFVPHVQRVLRILEKRMLLASSQAIMRQWFDASDAAGIILDHRRNILQANKAAEGMFTRGVLARDPDGRWAATNPQVHQALHEAIDQLAAANPQARESRTVTVDGEGGLPRCCAQITREPTDPSSLASYPQATISIVFFEPAQNPPAQ